MRTIEELNQAIAERRKALDDVTGTETEIYSRIVGYYRSLKNWNRGKREEFEQRRTYDVAVSLAGTGTAAPATLGSHTPPADATAADSAPATSASIADGARLRYYFSTTCPRCIAMKRAVDGRLPTDEINVEDEAGFSAAASDGITMTPTVIVYDESGVEIARSSDPAEVADWPLSAIPAV